MSAEALERLVDIIYEAGVLCASSHDTKDTEGLMGDAHEVLAALLAEPDLLAEAMGGEQQLPQVGEWVPTGQGPVTLLRRWVGPWEEQP